MRPLDLLAPQDRFLRDAMQLPRDLSQSGGGKSVGDPPFQLCGSIDDLLRLQFVRPAGAGAAAGAAVGASDVGGIGLLTQSSFVIAGHAVKRPIDLSHASRNNRCAFSVVAAAISSFETPRVSARQAAVSLT